MIPFAVHHEGIAEGQGRWVLHIDGERALLSEDDGTLYWHDLADCKLVRAQTPDVPSMVLPVQPQPGQQLVTAPAMPRAERRAQVFGR